MLLCSRTHDAQRGATQDDGIENITEHTITISVKEQYLHGDLIAQRSSVIRTLNNRNRSKIGVERQLAGVYSSQL
mgnify:CR=1 FL=1